MGTREPSVVSKRPGRGHPVFAAVYDLMQKLGERSLHPWRQRVVAGARGEVLEIGVGTGLNLPHYHWHQLQSLVGLEPDPYMRVRAERRAARLQVPLTLVDAPAEAIPFSDASFDSVVATHVLCSVSDPAQAVAEIMRVLRPGGEFRLLEHVRSSFPEQAAWQDRLTPLWRRIGAGCHPNRDTLDVLERAGFRLHQLEAFDLGPLPVRPHRFAIARKWL